MAERELYDNSVCVLVINTRLWAQCIYRIQVHCVNWSVQGVCSFNDEIGLTITGFHYIS